MIINGYKLVKTCGGCPEQYDVYDIHTTERVGYLRLRHGYFRVDCPSCGETIVYEACPNGDGSFEEGERDFYLNKAVQKIDEYCEKIRQKITNKKMREITGNVKSNKKLVTFLYLLMRDELVCGKVERVIFEIEKCNKKEQLFTNGWLARYADNLASRLLD